MMLFTYAELTLCETYFLMSFLLMWNLATIYIVIVYVLDLNICQSMIHSGISVVIM